MNNSPSYTSSGNIYFEVFRRINDGSWEKIATTGISGNSAYIDTSLKVDEKITKIDFRTKAYFISTNGVRTSGDYSNVITIKLKWYRYAFWDNYRLDITSYNYGNSTTTQMIGETNVR